MNNGRKVRLIGIDTPESFSNSKLEKDSQRTGQDMKTIQELGKRAAAFTRQFVERKEVSLKYGRQRKDRYGRTLGYLYLRDGTFVNLEIIRQGYANAYTQFPFEFMEEFRSAEKEAREDRRGLWAQ